MWSTARGWTARIGRMAGDHIAATAAVLRDPAAALAGCEQAWHMLVHGALVIRTPEGDDAVLETTLQLDGDMLVAVRRDLLEAGRSAEREQRTEQHLSALKGALLPLDDIAKALRAIHVTLFGAFGAAQTGYWLHFAESLLQAGEHWVDRALSLALGQLGCWLPLLLRWGLPFVVRWRLRARLRPVLQEWRRSSEREVAHMRSRRRA